MSMVMSSSGSIAGKNRSFHCYFLVSGLRTEYVQCSPVPYTSFTMRSQQSCVSIEQYIRFFCGCPARVE